MCGIIGITTNTALGSKSEFSTKELLERLQRMEYRGYDSFGYATSKTLEKHVGKITMPEHPTMTHIGLAHTRWATHGGVTQYNSHPHKARTVTIAHNGIIENWQELKIFLQAQGAIFTSDTDSEVIAHLIQHKIDERNKKVDMQNILYELIQEIKGTFAIVIMIDGDERLYVLKRDSPLALITMPNRSIVASDIYSFIDISNEVYFFEDEEYAIIEPGKVNFFKNKMPLQKTKTKVSWQHNEYKDARQHDHIMHKEIYEQPDCAQRILSSLATTQHDRFSRLRSMIRSANKVVFTAAGTAYHACLFGAAALQKQGIDTQALIASEFESFATLDDKTLVIAVSQSGETMDVISALKISKEKGAAIAAIINVPHSTIERMASIAINIDAGPEIAVASTKAFINQMLVLLSLAASDEQHLLQAEHVSSLLAQALLFENEIEKIAKPLSREHDLYIIGRGSCYPLAREVALKVKEISYVHAEGMMAGELKHGTMALIEQGTPVIAFVYNDDARMRSSVQEVRARGAHVISIGTGKEDTIKVRATDEIDFVLSSAVIGQLLAYHIAKAKGCPIDKPRNLAKSVTVL